MSEELESTGHQNAREAFDASVEIKCVPGSTVEDIDNLGAVEAPECDLYKYDTTEGACPKSPPEELEPTPDAAPYHYLNV